LQQHNTGILPPDVNRLVVTRFYACCIVGFPPKNGSCLPQLAPKRHGGAPTPVSALPPTPSPVVRWACSPTGAFMLSLRRGYNARAQPWPPHRHFVSITIIVRLHVALSKTT